MRIRKWLWTKIAEWKYRKQSYNTVCCCGRDMSSDNVWESYRDYDTYRCSGYYCPSRCAKEYAVTRYVKGKLKR